MSPPSRDKAETARETRDRSPGEAQQTLARAQAPVSGEHDGLRAVLDADLVEDVGDVVAHGLLRQVEPRRDLRVVQALRDQVENLALARRERGKRTGAGGAPAGG